MSQNGNSLENRITLAKSLGWKVWAYDVPDKPYDGNASFPLTTKRVYILKSPLNVPFNDGKPVSAQSATKPSASPNATVAGASYKVRYQDSERDAWGDLPSTEDEIRTHSEWGEA